MTATLKFRGLTGDEVTRLVSSLLRDWQASKVTIEDPALTKLKTRLTTTLASYQEGLAQLKDQATLEELAEADRQRDNDLQLLFGHLKLAKWKSSKEEKAAYKLLRPLFDGVSKAKKANYEEESAYINRLVGQLGTAPYQAAATLLGLTKPLQDLTKSQAAMEDLLLKKHTTNGSRKVYDNKASRQVLEATYRRLGLYLTIMSEEVGTAAYTKLLKVYDNNTSLFKPLAMVHKAKGKEEESDQAETPAPPSPQEP